MTQVDYRYFNQYFSLAFVFIIDCVDFIAWIRIPTAWYTMAGFRPNSEIIGNFNWKMAIKFLRQIKKTTFNVILSSFENGIQLGAFIRFNPTKANQANQS